MSNIVIIGAGPIGSYTAIKLASFGHKVTVLEKKLSPELNVCCTGIISKQCYDLLQPLSINNLVFRKSNQATFFTPSSKYISFHRTEDVAYIIDRPFLNKKLAEIAQNHEVHYIYSANTINISSTTKSVDVSVEINGQNNRISADAAIIATGLNRQLCDHLGLGTINDYIIGAQAQISVNYVKEVEIYLDHKLAPYGFAWLVPTINNKGLVGLITRSNPKNNLNNLLLKLQNEGKISTETGLINFGLIPLKPLRKTYADRILVIGAAAGQVKPVTGGGIYFGLICANIAVDTINKAASISNFTKSNLDQYQRNWHKVLLNEINIGNFAQKVWSKFDNKYIEYLINILNNKNIHSFINSVDNFQFDYHSRLILNTALSLLSFVKRK